ncbi:helix-turn-helix transcriptional regulator, partial [Vibrio cholerae]
MRIQPPPGREICMTAALLISMKRASELTSLSRSTIYRRIAERRFP